MGLFQNLFKGNANVSFEAPPMTILAPLDGCAMNLGKLPDEVFASGTLGNGCGIEPNEDTVYAPFEGVVTQVADTKHAIGLESSDGIELLIHVGVDTVEMNGKGFKSLAKAGDSVKAGSPLLKFDKAAIEAAGHPTVVAIIVTNTDDFSEVNLMLEGAVSHGSPLLKLSK
jgi:PTS system glucose-specific IIA component